MIVDHQNNFRHTGLHTGLNITAYRFNITEFLTKILLFPEDCAS